MKLFIIKAHGQWKVGDSQDFADDESGILLKSGNAITEGEFEARQLVKASNKGRVTDAVVRAKARNAVPPKDEAVLAKAIGQLDAGKADADVLVEFIDGIRATEDTTSHQRLIPGGAPLDVRVIQCSLEDAAQGVIKATEPQNNLIRSGNFKEAQRLAKEASIATREIMSRGQDFLLRDTVKAATFTDPNSQVGSLAGDMILVRNLGFLKNKLPWMGKLTTDLSAEPVQFGQQILTRYITPPGVLTWVPGVGFTSDATTISTAGTGTTQSGGTNQGLSGTPPSSSNNYLQPVKSVPSTTDKGVTLNKFKATEIEFPVSLLSGTVRNLFAEQYSAQTYSLAESINNDVLAGIFAATWSGIKTSYVKALGNWNLSGMIGVKNAMTISKIPDVGRFTLLHSFYHDKLLEDSNLLSAKAIMALIHKDESEFNTGEIPTLFGVKPLESQLASADANGVLTTWSDDTNLGTTKHVGFAGNMSSYLFVSRPPQDYTSVLKELGIPTTASIRLVSEPDSGLTVMVFSYADNGKMSISQRVCVMWGHSQGDPRVGFPIDAI